MKGDEEYLNTSWLDLTYENIRKLNTIVSSNYCNNNQLPPKKIEEVSSVFKKVFNACLLELKANSSHGRLSN